MSNALSQSASNLTLNGQSEQNWDFAASAYRAMDRKAKGLTKEAFTCKRQTIISVCCAEYRAHFAAIYGKSERLPSAVFEKIEDAVDAAIGAKLSLIHAGNAISVRRAFSHKANDFKFVLRTTAVGEDDISLAEQHLACVMALNQAEKRLTDQQAKKTPDYEREKEIKAQIMKLNLTLQFIEGEQKHQAELTK